MEDAIAVTALYVSLLRWLTRQDEAGALPPEPLTEIIAENRWVAHRYGTLSFFGDTTHENARVDIDDFVGELVEKLTPDARALGCEAELRHTLTIIREGSGADRQADLYRLRRLEGDSDEEAPAQGGRPGARRNAGGGFLSDGGRSAPRRKSRHLSAPAQKRHDYAAAPPDAHARGRPYDCRTSRMDRLGGHDHDPIPRIDRW